MKFKFTLKRTSSIHIKVISMLRRFKTIPRRLKKKVNMTIKKQVLNKIKQRKKIYFIINTIEIFPYGGDLIDGNSSIILAVNYGALTLIKRGTGWWLI